jgi:hypothetical protein
MNQKDGLSKLKQIVMLPPQTGAAHQRWPQYRAERNMGGRAQYKGAKLTGVINAILSGMLPEQSLEKESATPQERTHFKNFAPIKDFACDFACDDSEHSYQKRLPSLM